MAYPLLFLAGMLLCNAIPHLASGMRGERFFTPWARPRGSGRSSAVENFLWGSANLLAAIFVLIDVWPQKTPHGLIVLGAGFLLIGVGLSWAFGKRVDRGF